MLKNIHWINHFKADYNVYYTMDNIPFILLYIEKNIAHIIVQKKITAPIT